jgi:hypothetical protein
MAWKLLIADTLVVPDRKREPISRKVPQSVNHLLRLRRLTAIVERRNFALEV